MTKFDKLKERFPNLIPIQELRANVSIIELAIQYGYELQSHKGRNRPVLKHSIYSDAIIIKNPLDASQQVYQRSGDYTDSGTIIDFIRNRLTTVFSAYNRPGEHELKTITRVLYDYLRIDLNQASSEKQVTTKPAKPIAKQSFSLELFDIRPLLETNYLTSRHIKPETIDSPEFKGKIVSQVSYFDLEKNQPQSFQFVKEHPERDYLTFFNVAFPYYNGLSTEVTGLELRNENVKLHAPGSDKLSSVFVSNPPAKTKTFYILESVIDALSHKQLCLDNGNKAFDAVYFSTGGQLVPHQVDTVSRYINSLEKDQFWTISLGFDNDPKGYLYDWLFVQQLAATKLPLTPTTVSLNRIGYLLPEQAIYQPIRKALLDQIDAYNKGIHEQFETSISPKDKQELANQTILIEQDKNQTIISIPEACKPLSAVTRYILELTQLGKRISINKSVTKDFNHELSQAYK